MTLYKRLILRWSIIGLMAISSIASIAALGFWRRSYRRSDQFIYRYLLVISSKGAICLDQTASRFPLPLSWISSQANKQDSRIANPDGIIFGIQYDTDHGIPDLVSIPYIWIVFFASLPADIIGLFWTFRWSRKKDVATGGHLTVRISLYLAVIIPVLLLIVLLLS